MKESERTKDIYFLRHIYENLRSNSTKENLEDGYTKWWTWTISPIREQFLQFVPTVVLANDQIFSSADSFAKVVLDHSLATLVSNIVPLSGHGLPTAISLPSKRYAVTYGFMEIRGTDFSIRENVVEKPHVFSYQTLGDLYNNIDTMLHKSIAHILNQLTD